MSNPDYTPRGAFTNQAPTTLNSPAQLRTVNNTLTADASTPTPRKVPNIGTNPAPSAQSRDVGLLPYRSAFTSNDMPLAMGRGQDRGRGGQFQNQTPTYYEPSLPRSPQAHDYVYAASSSSHFVVPSPVTTTQPQPVMGGNPAIAWPLSQDASPDSTMDRTGASYNTRGRRQSDNSSIAPSIPFTQALRRASIPNVNYEQPGKSYFKVGTVFWSHFPELYGGKTGTSRTSAGSVNTTVTFKTQAGTKYTAKGRYYVVISHHEDHCVALGFFTNRGQGVAKQQCKRSDFCIAYTSDTPPLPSSLEIEDPGPQNPLMRPDPIRVKPSRRWLKFDPMTRLNLRKTYSPLDYNRMNLQHFGKVAAEDLTKLVDQWLYVRRDADSELQRQVENTIHGHRNQRQGIQRGA